MNTWNLGTDTTEIHRIGQQLITKTTQIIRVRNITIKRRVSQMLRFRRSKHMVIMIRNRHNMTKHRRRIIRGKT